MKKIYITGNDQDKSIRKSIDKLFDDIDKPERIVFKKERLTTLEEEIMTIYLSDFVYIFLPELASDVPEKIIYQMIAADARNVKIILPVENDWIRNRYPWKNEFIYKKPEEMLNF